MAEVVAAAENVRLQRQVAGALAEAGAVAGDRMAVLLPPSGDLLAAVLGALRTGVVPVPLDPATPPAERVALLADCRPRLVVDSPRALAELLAGPAKPLAPVPLARPMHYTSGTTGRRKGVWSGILDEAAATALLGEERALWQFSPDDRHLVFSPLYHSAPLRFAIGTLMAGGTVLLTGGFSIPSIVDAVARHRPTSAFCVPTHLRRLLADAGELPPLDSFRLLAHGGEPCPVALKNRVVEAFPAGAVYEFYGATEGQFTVCSTSEWYDRPDSVGRARPNRRLRIDQDSVIWCAAPDYARFTYWDDPRKSAEAWRGAEFSVGDVGRLDADGYLYLDGRRTDLIITGGVNVYPREVESVLSHCPGVDEIAVFGVDDEHWGQRLCAAVAGTAMVEELDGYARAHLPPARRPKQYHHVGELPRTNTGKIRRVDLPRIASA
jgi:long-chain acyl-CoA synthetase